MKVHRRDFKPWSPIWWLDQTGDIIPFSIAVSGIVVFVALVGDSFAKQHFDPYLAVFLMFWMLVITPVILVFASLGDLIFGVLGKPSEGVVGQQVFLVPAQQGHFSGGQLITTTEMLAFVPGASRRTGKYGKWEVETVVPFREMLAAELWWVWGFLPFGICITRTSGDREYFTVGRPRHIIREIENARAAWLAGQQRDQAAADQSEAIDATPSDRPRSL